MGETNSEQMETSLAGAELVRRVGECLQMTERQVRGYGEYGLAPNIVNAFEVPLFDANQVAMSLIDWKFHPVGDLLIPAHPSILLGVIPVSISDKEIKANFTRPFSRISLGPVKEDVVDWANIPNEAPIESLLDGLKVIGPMGRFIYPIEAQLANISGSPHELKGWVLNVGFIALKRLKADWLWRRGVLAEVQWNEESNQHIRDYGRKLQTGIINVDNRMKYWIKHPLSTAFEQGNRS